MSAVSGTFSAAAQSVGPMDPSAFAAELQRVETEISSGAPGRVPDVRVPSIWIVETGDRRVETSATWLRRALEDARRNPATWPAQRSSLLAQLEALKAEADALSVRSATEQNPNASAARTALTAVLSASEFKRMRRDTALSRLRQRFSQWLLRIWETLGGSVLGRRGTAIAFAWVATLATLAVLVVALLRWILRPVHARRLAPEPSSSKRRSARAWARDAVNARDPREATRYAYRATVCGLEEEGVWQSDDSRTPREYLRLLPPDHRRRRVVTEMTKRFEEIWFAARSAGEDDRAAVLAGLKELGCLPAD